MSNIHSVMSLHHCFIQIKTILYESNSICIRYKLPTSKLLFKGRSDGAQSNIDENRINEDYSTHTLEMIYTYVHVYVYVRVVRDELNMIIIMGYTL
ncbi:hypothetical protein J45TS6_35850 [Paenibacillus sp. J45TS6]|nr:hypothetical protein J45TS6_35850 [Paenibacillus sp. J45TS6]